MPTVKKPSENQWWILHRMDENNWTISRTELSNWLWDGHSRRKHIPKKTMRVLLAQGWIDKASSLDGSTYSITDRGRQAVKHQLPRTAGAAR